MKAMTQTFHVIIEKDEDGAYVGRAPQLRGCVSQGDTLDELMKNMKEAIELYLEVETEKKDNGVKFVGIQEVEVKTF